MSVVNLAFSGFGTDFGGREDERNVLVCKLGKGLRQEGWLEHIVRPEERCVFAPCLFGAAPPTADGTGVYVIAKYADARIGRGIALADLPSAVGACSIDHYNLEIGKGLRQCRVETWDEEVHSVEHGDQ
jgi:hypothetical protein